MASLIYRWPRRARLLHRHGQSVSGLGQPVNTNWGVTSYSANWQVFGDQPAGPKIKDGLRTRSSSARSSATTSETRCSGRRLGLRGGSPIDPERIHPAVGSRPVPRQRPVGQRDQPRIALLMVYRPRTASSIAAELYRPPGPERRLGCAGACCGPSWRRRSITVIPRSRRASSRPAFMPPSRIARCVIAAT